MSTVSRSRTVVRAAAVTACAAAVLALPTAAALAEGLPAASAAHSAGPQRTLVKTLSLADGLSTAKVYRIAANAHRADILTADGHKAATLTSRDGVTAVGSAGALHAALRPDGRLTSWVGDPAAQGGGHAVEGDGYKTGTRSGQLVHASAERTSGSTGTGAGTGSGAARSGSLAGGPADAPHPITLAGGPGEGGLLLAAGGGIAALGAAGLGYAMLRRGRTEG
ncbi:hypothetical protein [Streptomyces sp. NPDC002990]